MRKATRLGAASAAVIAVGAVAAVGAGGVGAASSGRSDSGVVYASIVHGSGKNLYAAGYLQSKLFGATAITYVVSVGSGSPGTFKIKAKKVTLYTSTGSLTGTGSATQIVTKTTSTVKDGKVSLTRGTGGQAGHRYTATFHGTFSNGVYTFHFKGTYN